MMALERHQTREAFPLVLNQFDSQASSYNDNSFVASQWSSGQPVTTDLFLEMNGCYNAMEGMEELLPTPPSSWHPGNPIYEAASRSLAPVDDVAYMRLFSHQQQHPQIKEHLPPESLSFDLPPRAIRAVTPDPTAMLASRFQDRGIITTPFDQYNEMDFAIHTISFAGRYDQGDSFPLHIDPIGLNVNGQLEFFGAMKEGDEPGFKPLSPAASSSQIQPLARSPQQDAIQKIYDYIEAHPNDPIPASYISRELFEFRNGLGWCLMGDCAVGRAAHKDGPLSKTPRFWGRLNHLYDHIRGVHFNHRPFQCSLSPTCQMSFVRKDDLACHKFRRHRYQRFPCGMCDNVYTLQDNLKLHIQCKHVDTLISMHLSGVLSAPATRVHNPEG